MDIAPDSPTNYRSKAIRLSEQLLVDLHSGPFAAHELLPAEQVVADHYGVSRLTIRRSIDLLAQRGALERLPHRGVRVVRTGGAGVAHGERVSALREKKSARPTYTMAMVIATRPDESLVRMRDGVRRYCLELGLSLHLITDEDDHTRPLAMLEGLKVHGINGAIVLPYPGDAQAELLEGLQKNGFPIVCVEKRTYSMRVTSVEPDAAGGTYQATLFLINKYRRAPWFMGLTTDHKVDADRYEGWRCAMRDAGYGGLLDDRTVRLNMPTSDPEWWRQQEKWKPGYEAAKLLLERVTLPASVVCDKDYLAWGLYRLAEERKLSIGPTGDLAITGFDDLAIAKLLEPPLTTISQDMEMKGYEAARLLHQRLIGGPAGARTVVLPVHLVQRGSA